MLGTFGKPTAPVEPAVLAQDPGPAAGSRAGRRAGAARVPELRRRFGTRISDEELLLRFAMPAAEVDAMKAAPAPATHYNPRPSPCCGCCGNYATGRPRRG